MNQPNVPQLRVEHARLATGAMVCTVDHLATTAATTILSNGGSAADAAVAASAVLAVTTQQMCGMGGDLWAVVHQPGSTPTALNSAGRAGSGSDPQALRQQGHTQMPFRHHPASIPIPGCVDGWLALHNTHGRLPLGDVLGPAISLAETGFAVSPFLANAIPTVADVEGSHDYFIDGVPARQGEMITRQGLARSLRAIAAEGRDGWYGGEFGEGLIDVGQGIFTKQDLAQNQAEWVTPTSVEVWDHQLWTVPPPSQGYLTLAGASVANGLDLPADPNDPLWGHLIIESAKQAAQDRIELLHENADPAKLLATDRLDRYRSAISPTTAARIAGPGAGGGTIYLCVVDENRLAISLMQSNAAGFGALVTVPSVGVFLQNRGAGFSLEPGHPAELKGGCRPPSTLCPALITNPDQSLRAVLGTMGGDGQPQVVLQMAARLLQAGQSPGEVMTAPRFTLTVPEPSGFNTWHHPQELIVALEQGSSWSSGLTDKGHTVDERPWGLGLFGHAHLIDVDGPCLAGVADPRAISGAAAGI